MNLLHSYRLNLWQRSECQFMDIQSLFNQYHKTLYWFSGSFSDPESPPKAL